MSSKSRPERGNALFIILIAIVLLGMLALTVSRGLEHQPNRGDKEKTTSEVGRVLAYVGLVKSTLQSMVYSGGVTAATLDLTLPTSANAFETPPFDKRLFHPKGGGVQYDRLLGGIATDVSITKTLTITGVGDGSPEVVMVVKMSTTTPAAVMQKLVGGSATPAGVTNAQFDNIFAGVAVTIGAGGICNGCLNQPNYCLWKFGTNYLCYFTLWASGS